MRGKKKSVFAGVISLALMASFALQPSAVAKAKDHTDHLYPVTEEMIAGKSFNVSRALIKARPEEVWHILTDYCNATRVFPLLKKCQVIEDRGPTKIMKHVVAPSGLLANYEYVLEVKENHLRSLEWKRVSGSFKEVDGFWKIEPADNGRHSLVTYASHVNGGMFMPQGLIKRQFKIDAPQVMKSLVSQAESNTHIASRRLDASE
ncbi:MAG TPA: SRPBCC family protein [Candidatus Obscuribacterales bacterium]